MKQGWEIKKLGEVCSITMGQSPSSDTYNDSEGLPFFQGNADFGKIHPSIRVYCNAPIRIADVDDILISVRAPIGAINIADCKCCIGRGLASIRNNAEVANEYIYHALIANKEKLIAQGTGSTFKSIGKEALKELSIPVPPREEQEKIVEELDCLSGVIEKKREQLKELDALAESIFYTMFGDPITNEKGWKVKKLGEVCTKKKAILRANKVHQPASEIRYIDISTIDNANNVITAPTNYKFEDAPSRAQQVVEYGDVLISMVRPNLKNIAIVNYDSKDMVASSGFCVLRAKSDISLAFLFYIVKSDAFTEYLMERVSGANYPAVRENDITDYTSIIPPLTLQQEFADKIDAIEKQKELIKQSITETEELFNSRMDYYFN